MPGVGVGNTKSRHPVWYEASQRGNGEYGAVGAGSGPTDLKTTKGETAKAPPFCSAHHPEVSLEPSMQAPEPPWTGTPTAITNVGTNLRCDLWDGASLSLTLPASCVLRTRVEVMSEAELAHVAPRSQKVRGLWED